jgi:hypothetical protein
VSARRGVLAVALVAVLGIAGLLLAAGKDGRSTAFSLDIPPAGPVSALYTGQAICQGPFTAPAAFGFVTPWISPLQATGVAQQGSVAGAAIALTVRDAATNERLATGTVAAGYVAPIAPSVALTRTVPSGRRIRVCLRSRGPGPVELLGAVPANAVIAGDDGTASSDASIALLFLRPHPRSLLSLVPTVFGRASLFRPGWVGPWTYWALSAALLVAFALAGVAVTVALRSDEAPHARQRGQIE